MREVVRLSLLMSLLLHVCQRLNGFTLDGSPGCYVRFPKWYHAFENTLSFEFVTGKPNGLLLYTDDGGGSNFFEISLVSGRLQLLFSLGKQQSGATIAEQHPVQVATIDSLSLNDRKWHRVNLYQFWERVQLQLDDLSVYKSVEHNEFVFGSYDLNSDVFIGGVPQSSSPDSLSYPAVKLMVHFEGSIRNLMYRTLPNGMTVPAMLDSVGVRQTDIDYCVEHICLNHGVCYSTDDGARCNCEETDFEGERCETGTFCMIYGIQINSVDLHK
ncbi:unnamed protein product [Soboliphyme baturini]|uniref:LAM_G_DOMAIN domain-containing protein n=1 Tax=Soboliphyme baturini TaxID=241478 RepID=A0A183IU95_9BILA|nr:unnamed protein product [Soboliphyme baturini]